MGIFDFLFNKPVKKVPSKIVVLDGIEYRFKKYKNQKTIKITIKEKDKVFVSLPYSCSYKDAIDFAKKEKPWINKNLENFKSITIDKNHKTKSDNFRVVPSYIDTPLIKTKNGVVNFLYPIEKDFYSNEIQTEAKKALKKALYNEAKSYLPKRLNDMANKYGFKYNKVFLKTSKTRWGSCSYNNNINLNINLMNLDTRFIDYVIVHELCHTLEKNHKEAFWNLVYNIIPNYKTLRKELKKFPLIV